MALGRSLASGTKELAVENTAEALTAESIETTGVLVTALKANAAVVRIGSSSVGGESYALEAGESVQIDFIDTSQIYVYGKKGDKVKYIGVRP